MIISIHILPNISRSKDIQAIQFCQLEYNEGNIFYQKSYRKCDRELSSRSRFFLPKKLEVKTNG